MSESKNGGNCFEVAQLRALAVIIEYIIDHLK